MTTPEQEQKMWEKFEKWSYEHGGCWKVCAALEPDAISLLKELRDTTPITMQRKKIDKFLNSYAGGQTERLAKVSSDTELQAPDRQGEALIAEPPAPDLSSEIFLKKLRADIVEKWKKEADFAIKGGEILTADEELDLILDMVRPYLRTTEPVNTGAKCQYVAPSGRCPIPEDCAVCSSEIRYDMVEEIAALKQLHSEMPHCLDYRMKDGFTIPTLNVLMALIDQRTTKPVAVSLEKCAIALADEWDDEYVDTYKRGAKAVLDAAKEQGAQFEYVD